MQQFVYEFSLSFLSSDICIQCLECNKIHLVMEWNSNYSISSIVCLPFAFFYVIPSAYKYSMSFLLFWRFLFYFLCLRVNYVFPSVCKFSISFLPFASFILALRETLPIETCFHYMCDGPSELGWISCWMLRRKIKEQNSIFSLKS